MNVDRCGLVSLLKRILGWYGRGGLASVGSELRTHKPGKGKRNKGWWPGGVQLSLALC